MRSLALCLALVVATACGASGVPQNADVTIHGTVLNADGKPQAGVPVALVNEADLEQGALDAGLASGVLALDCLPGGPPGACDNVHRTTTADDGTYSFHLRRAAGSASTFQLATGTADPGPAVNARFAVRRTDVALPRLRLWAPTVDLRVTRVARAQWPPLDAGAAERMVFFDQSGSDVIWSAAGKGTVALDARILEDSRGTAAVESTATVDSGGTTFRLTHRSARVPYAGTTGPPPTRRAACNPDPCTATDGDFAAPAPRAAAIHEVVVELDSPTNVALVPVRGCPARCDVELSEDGKDWKLVGSSVDPFFAITPPIGPAVGWVRVRSVEDLSRLAEVSVW